jgi:hypothetical protein
MPRRLHFSLRTFLQVLALVTFSLAVSATVRADPITVSGSFIVVNGEFFGPSGTANLTGENFSANVTDFGGSDSFGNFGISPCSRSIGGLNGPCTGASLDYVGFSSDLTGSFTVNGMVLTSGVVNSLNFQFDSVSFLIPPELLDDSAVLITAPFTFTGLAISPAFSETLNLQGQGTVTLLLTIQTVGSFTGLFLDRADYNFGPTVSEVTIQPVPEPVTLVLFLSGLAGTAVRVRHSSRRHR